MIVFPNAKINLGLRILNKRPDGFHNIETILYPVDLKDVLEIIPAKDGVFSFASTGISIPGDPEENLCIKAFYLLSSIFHLPPVKMHLHKAIPIGAGLGGGSSDGAFAIKLLNDLFQLKMTDEQMMDHARRLGSDCAFFIRNKPGYAFQKGDQFEFLDLDLSGYRIEIITPEIHINTGDAYAIAGGHKGYGEPESSLIHFIRQPVKQWKDLLFNDFEKPLFRKYPELQQIKQDFYDRGALYASLSGSGSSLYGLFHP